MRTRQNRLLAVVASLSALAVGVYMLTAPVSASAADNCQNNQCAYSSTCYSPGSCVQSVCTAPQTQQCVYSNGLYATWAGCADNSGQCE